MKTLILFCMTIFSAKNSAAQVNWVYNSIKIADKVYEIHLRAAIQDQWHIYSQSTPEGGPIATKIVFSKSPLVQLNGKIKERGVVISKREDVFGVYVKYYNDSVDFVQTIKLISNVKTSITGTIEYMACNDHECLPPKAEKFTIKIE